VTVLHFRKNKLRRIGKRLSRCAFAFEKNEIEMKTKTGQNKALNVYAAQSHNPQNPNAGRHSVSAPVTGKHRRRKTK
jgi:hypothetical protein